MDFGYTLAGFVVGTVVGLTGVGGLLLGSIPGITLGSLAAARLPERALSPLLASLLVAIGGKLLTQ